MNSESHSKHLWLGRDLLDAGRPAEAVVPLRAATVADPADGAAWHYLGLALARCGDPAAAADAYRAAVAADPAAAGSWGNLGVALYELGRPAEAVVPLRRSLALDPGQPAVHHALGLCLLALGDWAGGWPAFEHRRQCQPDPAAGERLPPPWRGEDPRGRTLLVVCEGGLGDTLQFVRYAAVLAARGARVLVRCQPGLAPLLAGADGVAAAVPAGQRLPPADYHALTLSLPLLLGTRPDSVPAAVPYVRPDPARVDRWRDRVAALLPGPGPRVGVSWQGTAPTLHCRSAPDPVARAGLTWLADAYDAAQSLRGDPRRVARC